MLCRVSFSCRAHSNFYLLIIVSIIRTDASTNQFMVSRDVLQDCAGVVPSVGVHCAAVDVYVAEACVLFCTPTLRAAVLETSFSFFAGIPYAVCVHNYAVVDTFFVGYYEPVKELLAVDLRLRNGFGELHLTRSTIRVVVQMSGIVPFGYKLAELSGANLSTVTRHS